MFKGIFKNALRAVRREIDHKLKAGKESKPYHLWAKLTRRKAAAVAPTRQCMRRALTKVAFLSITAMYPGEPRAARRKMARSMAKNQWREHGLEAFA